jgi:hypothetical protein
LSKCGNKEKQKRIESNPASGTLLTTNLKVPIELMFWLYCARLSMLTGNRCEYGVAGGDDLYVITQDDSEVMIYVCIETHLKLD